MGLELEIHAFRSTNRNLDSSINSLLTKEFYSVKELQDDYDITFVTNPTHLHFNTIKFMVNKSKHMFIEKPIFESRNYDLSELELNENNIYHVATPLRFTNIIKNLKKFWFMKISIV